MAGSTTNPADYQDTITELPKEAIAEGVCKEPEVVEGIDPNREASPFRNLGTEVCTPLEPPEDQLIELPENAFVLCPTCIPDVNWEPNLLWWERNYLDNPADTREGIVVASSEVWLNEKQCEYKIVLNVATGFPLTWAEFRDQYISGNETITNSNGDEIDFSKLLSIIKKAGITKILEFRI